MTMTTLADRVRVKGRFARSVRLDRDGGSDVLAGYLPTGRSLEVVRRITRGLTRDDGARAFSITGPYGSGKSSLAVLIDSLLGPEDGDAYRTASAIVGAESPDLVRALTDARAAIGVPANGFIRAVITAPQREPVTTTVLRALVRGAERYGLEDDRVVLAKALKRAESSRYQSPAFDEIRRHVERLVETAPLLLLIDEFGKNLEAFADSGGDGDLYLLQELAEWTLGENRLPLVLVTIQHLAFEAYTADASAAQRREWAKVQGRLEDIPFLDSSSATRGLLATALEHDSDATYTQQRERAAQAAAEDAERCGVPEVADAELLAACYPLHPSTLLVLPDLCARYGQNERTLFSFLASDEPMSAKQFLADAPPGGALPWVRLDRVYDYFVQSASTFVGASRDASRWVEIETTIRDAHGLTEPQRRVLKTIGVFNLVSALGTMRASADLIAFALAGSGPDLMQTEEVKTRIKELFELGVIVHRDFAGEYRIWRGSDFDLQGAMEGARRRAKAVARAKLLDAVAPLPPMVAARHAVKTGTTRAFRRTWSGTGGAVSQLPKPDSAVDGLLLYVIDDEDRVGPLPDNSAGVPLVTVTPAIRTPVIEAAVEVHALREVSADPSIGADDHALRRELSERLAYAVQRLEQAVSDAYATEAVWQWLNASEGWKPDRKKPLGTSFLSDVLDAAYAQPWHGAYEAINRAELTSQGAKARRLVLEAMVSPSTCKAPCMALEGDGPEVAIWRSVLHDTGLHQAGTGITGAPNELWRPVWDRLMSELDDAVDAAVSARHLLDVLLLPPHGLRTGVASVVLVAGLLHRAADIAVYEHGTFKPRLDAALIERLVRNPSNFAVKFLAAADQRSIRGRAVAQLGDRLGLSRSSVLGVVSTLVQVLREGDRYVRTSGRFHAAWDDSVDPALIGRTAAIRDALLHAHEPDDLLFHALPAAVGLPRARPTRSSAGESMSRVQADEFAEQLIESVTILRNAEVRLAEYIASRILSATRARSATGLAADAELLLDVDIVAEDVRVFAGHARLAAYADTHAEWVGRIATAITGKPPRAWIDAEVGPNVDRIVRVAGNFRRVAALASHGRHRDSGGEPFTAWALAATATDGSHHDVVAALPDRHAAAADRAVEEAVAAMAEAAGVRGSEAEEMLLAAVAQRLLADRATAAMSHPSGMVAPTATQPHPPREDSETA